MVLCTKRIQFKTLLTLHLTYVRQVHCTSGHKIDIAFCIATKLRHMPNVISTKSINHALQSCISTRMNNHISMNHTIAKLHINKNEQPGGAHQLGAVAIDDVWGVGGQHDAPALKVGGRGSHGWRCEQDDDRCDGARWWFG
jgi:hypothetical protein